MHFCEQQCLDMRAYSLPVGGDLTMLLSHIEKSRNEMFDREYELNKIISAINDEMTLIVVTLFF
ncbi:hypothetical protein [Thermococcus sp.]|uniref:hypothetical protein n=1 Tax=Thermococcus sp. TaxID=35749 RepID=UPI002629E32D|nr:hypothetical protein [Thermococcus sp.]